MGGSQSQEEGQTSGFSSLGAPSPPRTHRGEGRSHSDLSSSSASSLRQGHSHRREQMYHPQEEVRPTKVNRELVSGRESLSQPRLEPSGFPSEVTLSQLSHHPPPPHHHPSHSQHRPSHSPSPSSQRRRHRREEPQNSEGGISIPHVRGPRRQRTRGATDPREQEFIDLEHLLSALNLHILPRTENGDGTRSTRNGNGTDDQNGTRTDLAIRRIRHGRSSRGSRAAREPGLQLSSSSPSMSPFLLLRGRARKKCPLCSEDFPAAEFDTHFVVCSSKPRVKFNVDRLNQDAGECTICLDDMVTGDKIARLPCLCVYHIDCLKEWYKKSQTCPEHPDVTDPT